MLNKFVINLKNVIFFKLTIYLISIAISGSLIPYFKQSFDYSTSELEKSKRLYETALNLYSNKTNAQGALHQENLYKETVTIDNYESCTKHKNIIEQLENLKSKYKLNEPIVASISKSFFKDAPYSPARPQIRIKNYEATLKFKAPDTDTFLAIIKDAYNIMPKDSMLVSVGAEVPEALTPEVIEKLSQNYIPSLIYASLVVKFAEIHK